MKNQTKAIYINKFLRGFPDIFTKNDFVKYMSFLNCSLTENEVDEILEESPYLYQLDSESYITKAGVFAHKYFSVALTKEEIAQKCFMPGHRLIPFIDSDALSSTVTFCFGEKILPKKIVSFSRDFALKHFSLYGEEYETQYIASDPGMANYNLADNDFELPAKVNLQCVDISTFFENKKISVGDRLLLKVIDWDECIIKVSPLVREKDKTLKITKDDIDRQKWFKDFEKTLFEVFDTWGPCTSIEEQISRAFFINIAELTKKSSGSVEEFLEKTKKIDVGFFGVETRLWKKGEQIPLVPNEQDDLLEQQNFESPEFVLGDLGFEELKALSEKSFQLESELKKENFEFENQFNLNSEFQNENFSNLEKKFFDKNDSINNLKNLHSEKNLFENENKNFKNISYSVPDYILDEFIKNYAYQKKSNLEEIIKEVFPSSFYLSPEYRQSFLLHIQNRNDIILENYNWFADFQLGQIRKKTLELYSQINDLVYEIDRLGGKFKNYPQQELVILIQLFTHISKLIESMAFDPAQTVRDFETISVSLEGMELNFEDIEPEIKAALISSKRKKFKVVK